VFNYEVTVERACCNVVCEHVSVGDSTCHVGVKVSTM